MKAFRTVVVCVILVAVAIVVIGVFKVPVKSLLPYGILLACPLLHLFMMRGDGHKH